MFSSCLRFKTTPLLENIQNLRRKVVLCLFTVSSGLFLLFIDVEAFFTVLFLGLELDGELVA